MQHPIIITGEPGAGKTTLAAQLSRAFDVPVVQSVGGQETSQAIDVGILQGQGVQTQEPSETGQCHIVEHCGYGSPWQGQPGTLIAVIDAVSLSSPGATLVAADAQIVREADLVVLSRSDLIDPTHALQHLASVTDACVQSAVFGALDAGSLPEQRLRAVSLPARTARVCWSYSGGAQLDASLCEALLKGRPKGVQRIKGQVVSGENGLRLDQAGRARSVTPCAVPVESQVFAAGISGTFRAHEMDLHFAETITSGVATSGWFGFR